MALASSNRALYIVTSLVEVWIEIEEFGDIRTVTIVTSLVEVWIEIAVYILL